jgi:hypothetical protein
MVTFELFFIELSDKIRILIKTLSFSTGGYNFSLVHWLNLFVDMHNEMILGRLIK